MCPEGTWKATSVVRRPLRNRFQPQQARLLPRLREHFVSDVASPIAPVILSYTSPIYPRYYCMGHAHLTYYLCAALVHEV
jgi:hypothetical protein